MNTMNPTLKAYLDKLHAETRAQYEEIHKKFQLQDALFSKFDTGASTSQPAHSPVVTSDDGLTVDATAVAAVPDVSSSIAKAHEVLEVPHDASPDCIEMAPVTCSTECAAQAVTASITMTLLPWASISSSSPATSATNGVVSTERGPDNDADEHGTSLASYSLSSSPTQYTAYEDASPAAPTPTAVSDTQLLRPFPVQVLSPLAPANCSTECYDIRVVDLTKLSMAMSHEVDKNEVLGVISTNGDGPGDDQRPPWPPPELEILCSFGIQSMQLNNVGFENSPSPVGHKLGIATQGMVKVSVLKVCWSSAPPSFLMEIFSPKGIFSPDGSGSFAVQSAVETILVCNNDEGYPAYVLSDKLWQHDNVQWKSWPIPITFPVFAMSLELALNQAAIGPRVLLILSNYDALRYLVLWSFTTAVLTEIVNMFNTHPSAAVMIELVSAVAGDHSWDVPLLFSMYPSISFGTVQILFSMYMSDKLVSVAAVAIWWFPSAPCKYLEAFRLHQAHLQDTCTHTGQLWNDLMTSSNSRFRPHKCMHGINTNGKRVESLGGPNYVLYSRISFLLHVHLIMVKSKQQVAVYSNCPAYRQLDLGANTTGYSDCEDSMMVVNNSAISLHVKDLQSASVSTQLHRGNIVSVLSCGLIHLGKLGPNWKFAHSAIGRPTLFIPIQSVALKSMELWWFTTTLLTEIASMLSTGFSMQLDGACSVQSILLFTPAYQLCILAPTMFGFAWGNVDCISISGTTRCALQVPSSELLLFIVTLGRGKGNNGVVTRKQRGILVLHTDVPWYPGGSIWHWWFSTCYDQDPFQGRRHAIAVTTFFEQVSGDHQYYLDLEEVRASASYDIGAFFEWAPIDHDYYFYLIEVNTYSGYCRDSDRIKDHRLQWDPGKFLAMSAWGQAEFQGRRDVRTPACVPDVGLLSWASTGGPRPSTSIASYTQQEATKKPSSGSGKAWHRRLSPLSPFFYLQILVSELKSSVIV